MWCNVSQCSAIEKKKLKFKSTLCKIRSQMQNFNVMVSETPEAQSQRLCNTRTGIKGDAPSAWNQENLHSQQPSGKSLFWAKFEFSLAVGV